MQEITILDKTFSISISEEKIQKRITEMAHQINEELKGKEVIFMAILNGAFMFASDLYKQINIDSQITFLKLASYSGTSTSGNVKRLIGINEDIQNKTVVVLEDIIDTGITMGNILKQLNGYEPAEIKVATFLLKPEVFQNKLKVDYIGLEIPNEFIVGYGLDYNGFGRNYKDIYTLVK